MKDYQEFKQYLEEHILEYLPEEYQNANISFREKEKINGQKLDAILISREGENMVPSIYIQDGFRAYQQGVPLEIITRNLAESRENAEQAGIGDISEKLRNISQKLFPVLVNKCWNEELLAHTPHRELLDLALIYKADLGSTEESVMTIPITNEALEMLKSTTGITYTEELLFQQAQENAKGKYHYKIRSLTDMFRFQMDGETEEGIIRDGFLSLEEITCRNMDDMFAVRNDTPDGGAAVLMNKELLQEFAERLGQNLVIIPSSTQEVLVIGQNLALSAKEMTEMIQDINGNESLVSKEECLSDNAYVYDKEERELMLYAEYEKRQLQKDPMKEILRKTAMRCSGSGVDYGRER